VTTEGAQRRARAQGAKHEQLRDELASLDPAMAAWADDFIFGEIWGREGICRTSACSWRLRPWPRRASRTAAQLPSRCAPGGISARKINEALLMMVVYAGFPTRSARCRVEGRRGVGRPRRRIDLEA